MVTSRDLLEVFEALPSQPWPARFRALALDDQIEIVLPEQVLNDTTKEAIERRFRLSGIELHVSSCGDREQDIRQLRSLRADLLETTFAARRN